MRAAILRNVGDTKLDVVDDVSIGQVGPNQVKIAIKSAGLCHSDLSAMNGTIMQPVPAVLGHEGCGDVIEIGQNVTNVSVGDKVIVAWNASCGNCNACIRGEYHLCLQFLISQGYVPHFKEGDTDIFGFAGNGTFSEEMIIPDKAAIKIPNEISYEVGALIGCGVMTGVGAALNTAKVVPGSSVAVFGCGGVGISAIQGAKIAGAAEIIAIDTQDSKLEDAKRFGATHSTKPDDLKAVLDSVTQGEGTDYAFECIGLPATIRSAYDSVRRGGTAVVVGAGRMDQMVEFNAFELFFQEKKFIGSYYGSANVRRDFLRLIRLYQAKRLDLDSMISAKMDISEINTALDNLRSGNVIRQVFTF
jgi:S-(hydroxymethyl)glutathione dehydrogenase/alcohol dehydrogenase